MPNYSAIITTFKKSAVRGEVLNEAIVLCKKKQKKNTKANDTYEQAFLCQLSLFPLKLRK